jgi:hypothetical protein
MTVAAARRNPRPKGQKALKRLAVALACLCLVLFLLAIEQRQAVAVWQAIRSGTATVAGQASAWTVDRVADLSTRAAQAGPVPGAGPAFGPAFGPVAAPIAAAAGDAPLAGEFAAADEATRAAVASVTFAGAVIRLDGGETLRTAPLRIAAGRESFAAGQTFADRLEAPGDAQVELRRIAPGPGQRDVAPSALCGGQAPGTAAILHRRDRVELMLFRADAAVGPQAPASAVCGAWSFRRP